ncbi:MAG: hypothetical protein JJ974_09900 [Phycisphaerales bacterium]|nr:hypothetical protein [Phycisphaerales bacterium]
MNETKAPPYAQINLLIGICIILTMIIITNVASAQDCNDCDEGYTPGEGTVTVDFSSRTYIFSQGCPGGVECTTVLLNGTQITQGIQTYDGIVVDVTGTLTRNDDTCCGFGPTGVTPLLGTITSYKDGTAVIDYWSDTDPSIAYPIIVVVDDSGTCSDLTLFESTGGSGTQTIHRVNTTFRGGQCEDENGDPPDDPDPDPDDPPEPPEPPEPDPDDPPDPPEPPIPPDSPDDEEEEDDPIIPDPPEPDPSDPCCIAITTRLDALIAYAETNHHQNNTTIAQLNGLRQDLYTYMNDLLYGNESGGVLHENNTQNSTMIYNQERVITWLEHFNEYFHDTSWYLQQLYNEGIHIDQGDSTLPSGGDPIALSNAHTAITGLPQAHRDNMSEHQDFHLPDITAFQNKTPPSTFTVDLNMINQYYPLGLPVLSVDMTPYSGIRDVATVAMLLGATLNGIFIVWRDMRIT